MHVRVHELPFQRILSVGSEEKAAVEYPFWGADEMVE